jgi:thioesterase domain-containing protein
LFSPGYELEAGVAFEVAPPSWQAGRYRALQTDLDIVQGQPVVRIRYLWRAPARTGEDDANAKLGSVFEVVKELALDLEHGCLAPRAP